MILLVFFNNLSYKKGVQNDRILVNYGVKPCQMRAKHKASGQLNFLAPTLKAQLNPHHPLYLLAAEIDWAYFDDEFSCLYSEKGRPAHSIRLMTSLLLLKSIQPLR